MILVTGGAGYVGAHVVRAILEAGGSPLVYDDLSTGHVDNVPQGTPLIVADILDRREIVRVFDRWYITDVVHLAALASLPDSVANPLRYYEVNAAGTLSLVQYARAAGATFVLASTEAVGIAPYGKSKGMAEDFVRDSKIRGVCLRIANAAGADPDGECGSRPGSPHLVDRCVDAALGMGDLHVFDSLAAMRDYVHVHDVARAFVEALLWLKDDKEPTTAAIRSGVSRSVGEVVDKVRKIVGPFDVEMVGKRPGDVDVILPDTDVKSGIGKWKPEKSFQDIVEDTARWRRKLAGRSGQ